MSICQTAARITIIPSELEGAEQNGIGLEDMGDGVDGEFAGDLQSDCNWRRTFINNTSDHSSTASKRRDQLGGIEGAE